MTEIRNNQEREQSSRETDADTPEIVVPMILCPKCGSEDRGTRTSRLRPDGVRVSHCQCRECGQRYRVLFSPTPQ